MTSGAASTGKSAPRSRPCRRRSRSNTEAMRAKTNESPSIKSKMDDVAEAVAAVSRAAPAAGSRSFASGAGHDPPTRSGLTSTAAMPATTTARRAWAGSSRPLELPAVGEMLDLEGVPGRGDVADRAGPGRSLAAGVDPGGGLGCPPGGRRHPRHQPGLDVGDPPLAAVRLDQAHDGDVRAGVAPADHEHPPAGSIRVTPWPVRIKNVAAITLRPPRPRRFFSGQIPRGGWFWLASFSFRRLI